jgi:hypothetical protein
MNRWGGIDWLIWMNLESSWAAAQLATSHEGLSSIKLVHFKIAELLQDTYALITYRTGLSLRSLFCKMFTGRPM